VDDLKREVAEQPLPHATGGDRRNAEKWLVYFEHKQTLSRIAAVARPTAPTSAHAKARAKLAVSTVCALYRRLLSYVKLEQMHVAAGGRGAFGLGWRSNCNTNLWELCF
jgi:hypothetical protein